MHVIAAAFAIVLVLIPPGAFAQVRGTSHPQQQGQTQIIGSNEVEPAIKGTEAALFILDNNERKVDATRLSVNVEVLVKGNERKTIELKPAGDDRLAAKADFAVESNFRATVMPGNSPPCRSAVGDAA